MALTPAQHVGGILHYFHTCIWLCFSTLRILLHTHPQYRLSVKPSSISFLAFMSISVLPGTRRAFGRIFTALQLCKRGIVMSICLSVCPSVCLSVCLSVKHVNCEKKKAPSEKSSIMTNRKLPTSFPMSLRRTAYVAAKPSEGAPKATIFSFSV